MTRLEEILKRQIATQGPLTIAQYMSECLLHPQHGYYTTQTPFGAEGDFITAPEVSQMFGELLGLSLAQSWLDQGAPTSFILAELGPGRGTLMSDIWRATRGVPGFHDAAQVTLLEAAPAMRTVQAETLADAHPTWIESLADLPELPLFLVANEYFDTLPVRQFLRSGAGWCERVVGLTEGALSFGLTPALPLSELAHRIDDTQDGDLVELSAAAETIAQAIGGHIAQHGGAALIFDYGDWRSTGDTFQAVRRHQKLSPLDGPGTADLTAHIDFERLTSAAACQVSQMQTQGIVLERLGITQRAQTLSQGLKGPALEALINAHRRLTHPDEMGTLFKTIAFAPDGAPLPAGYD